MAIPDYQTIMLPLLRFVADGKEHSLPEATDALRYHFKVSDNDMRETVSSGAPVFSSRVGWAKTYLKQAGLLDQPKRGIFVITEQGKSLLAENPTKIDVKLLGRYPQFLAFRSRKNRGGSQDDSLDTSPETPEELLARAYQALRDELEQELLDTVKKASPSFFERLVVDLLVRMGYGGSRQEAGRAIGRSGDEGIDGIINEDKLGLDVIYIQAKRWENVVGRPEIQKFAGALMGQGAGKGIFITTSYFSKEAVDYAAKVNQRIILIDGSMLASLMVDAGVGVTPREIYKVKRIDLDYFEE